MKLDWPHDHCIACLHRFDEADPTGPQRRSEAHVIADALGGKLRATFLCSGCNGKIGTRFEDELPLNPPHRDEIERFAGIVPDFEKQLRKAGRKYVAQTEHGPLTMKRDRDTGEFRVVDTTLPAGRFKDTRDAAAEIRHRLEKQKAEPAEVEEVMANFARGEPVQVGEDTFMPRTGDLVPEPTYDTYICADEAYLAMAYLWLGCVVDKFVYAKELDGVREALVGREPTRDGSWKVDRFHVPRDSAPWHRLAMSQVKPAVIDVTLFGRWFYRVTFETYEWPGRAFGYRLNLATDKEEVADLPRVTEPPTAGADT